MLIQSKQKMLSASTYTIVYIVLFILELLYVSLLWSPYGKPDGMLHNMYQTIKNNLRLFVIFNIMYLAIYSFIFPGIGWLSFIVTLWRITNPCYNNENFRNELHDGLGRYCPDYKTFFNEAHLEREQDGTRAAYSSAVGDNEDIYWLANHPKNINARYPIHPMRMKKFVFEMLNEPRSLYTTSLLAKEMKSS